MKGIFNTVSYLKSFEKDFKKLQRRFPTLNEDLETFINTALKAFHKLDHNNLEIIPINNLGITNPIILKAKKFACKSLKGKGVQTGIRIIYAYYHEENKIEFIEIYFKGDKENEDRDRILNHYNK